MAITTLFLTGVELSARMYRGLVTDLFGEGIRNVAAGEFQVIPRALGANMTVTVRKGTGPDAVAYIVGDDVAGQGTYRVTQDADFLDLGIAAAPASGSRNDLVVLETVDSQIVGGATNLSRLRVLTGVSAITSEKTVIPLARISVPAGTTSIQASNITDLRTAQTGGGGAVRTAAQPLSAAQIAALTGMRIGDLVFNTDFARSQEWNGTVWRSIGQGASGKATFGSVALPASTTTFTAVSFFVGLGFTEVQLTLDASGVGYGITLLATTDASQAQFQSVGSNGSTTYPVIVAAATSTTVAQFGYTNDSLYLRNARVTSDGFFRCELAAAVAKNTSTLPALNWRAR